MKILILIAMIAMFIGCSDNDFDNDNEAQVSRDISPSPKVEDKSLQPPEIPSI